MSEFGLAFLYGVSEHVLKLVLCSTTIGNELLKPFDIHGISTTYKKSTLYVSRMRLASQCLCAPVAGALRRNPLAIMPQRFRIG